MLAWLEEFILHAAAQWWVLPVTGLLCLLDGIVPAFPSESVLVALAAIVKDGQPFALTALWAVGAVGAFCGDNLAYLIGRTVGADRWRWMRSKAVAGAMGMARRNLDRRGAFLLFTARFIPGGRVAVNLTAGATRYSYLRFVLLDAIACLCWSAYSILIARVTTGWLDSPLAKVAVSLAGAFVVGLLLDRLIHLVLSRREQAVARRTPGTGPTS
ncbi:DedA family protein [Micrococcus lylae]|uniref:DedA family protein n=1 Tax=Micrococcus lylae TaxID=1273 RepID=UPI000C801205|nr:DedA family protein [Micrococcus lylae]MCT2006330.1 DedA family protein [Micrococcus lylae]MCT2070283.1 DedA family protein [Micrococcus lylae]WIK82310.1 DedA family protein [Micrococcus lylae]